MAAWCEFPTAEPLVSTLGVALPALAGPVSPQSWVRVLIGGMAALKDAAYWAQMPYLDSIVLDLDPAAYPAPWPGSDWDNLEKMLPSGLPESQSGNFSARGVLVEPVKVLATDGMVAVMRDAGFVVTLDLGNVPAPWFPVTVHPRTSRTLVV